LKGQPMALKQLVQSGLNRFGLNVTRTPPPHELAHHVKRFIREHEITLVLDVGAYRGAYCQMLREEVGYRGLIASFEPCARSFAALSQQMAQDRNWRGYQFGLSEKDTTAVLNTFEAGDFNSLLGLRQGPASVYDVDLRKASTEEIQLRKIDSIWPELTDYCPSPRIFLKIDTQGHDTAVARGAAQCLEHILGIQTELPVIELYDGMTSMGKSLEFYNGLGYVPIGFFPVNTPKSYGASPEFDVLLTRFSGERSASSAL